MVGGLALADLGHDLRSSDSLGASRNFLGQVSNAPISRRPNITKLNLDTKRCSVSR